MSGAAAGHRRYADQYPGNLAIVPKAHRFFRSSYCASRRLYVAQRMRGGSSSVSPPHLSCRRVAILRALLKWARCSVSNVTCVCEAVASSFFQFCFGSRTVLAVTPAERQLTLRFRTKSLQRGSRQFRAKSGSEQSHKRAPPPGLVGPVPSRRCSILSRHPSAKVGDGHERRRRVPPIWRTCCCQPCATQSASQVP